MVALGALNKSLHLVELESLEKALKRLLPEHRHKLIPMNIAALKRGASMVGNGG
jgi:2-oxoglutarate ferredoxin oxidoreductase subunit gamma